MSVRPLSMVTVRAVDWLWPSRLARGKLTLFDGDPGLGKSWLTLDLCARLSRGQCWPDGATSPPPANSLVFNAEDNEADTIAPRVAALGGDLARVFVWPSEKALPRFPTDLALLDDAIQSAAAQLVVLDPLHAFLEPHIAADNDRIRDVALRLAHLALQRRCAILLLRHLAKRSARGALYRGLGGIALVAACRLSWFVARDPTDPSCCVLASLKTNLAPKATSLAYRLGSSGDCGAAGVQWLGPSPWLAEALSSRHTGRPAARRDRAARFLHRFLSQRGPCLADRLWSAAKKRGIARRTLFRVKKQVGAVVDRVPGKGEVLVLWRLPHQELPEYLRPPPRSEVDDWLDKLR